MSGIQSQIVAGVIAALNEITIDSGYNYDLSPAEGGGGAQPVRRDYQSATLPRAIVSLWRSSKDVGYQDEYAVTADLHIQVTAPLPDDPMFPIEEALQNLVDDVERRLSIARQSTPPLGIAGLDDIVLRDATLIPWDDEDDFLDSLIEMQVLFHHRLTDPAAP